MKTYQTNSAKETKELAKKLAKNSPAKIILLSGDLGSGKTTFAQGFARGLGINDKIISPTFVLIRQHKIPKTKNLFYHIDLYRLENKNQLKNLGLNDLFDNPNNFIVVEWAEKLKELPKNTIRISIKNAGSAKRILTIEP